MSATAAGRPGRRAGVTRRGTMAAAPGQPTAPAGSRQRVLLAGPGRVPAAVPGQRTGPAVHGRPAMSAPGQRATVAPAGTGGQRDATAERRGWPAAKPGRPALVVVPSLPAVPDESPGVPAAEPKPGAGTDERARRPSRQAPGRPARATPARTRRPGAVRRPRTRLTRRGRIVVAVLTVAAMLLVAALAWIAGAAKVEAAGSGSGPPPSAVYRNLKSVVVQPGESLWTVASQAEPNADPWSVIQEIIDLNALGGMSVQPGQHLWVPRG